MYFYINKEKIPTIYFLKTNNEIINFSLKTKSIDSRINLYKEELLVKILKKYNNKTNIIDTTAGFGKDAIIIASAGYKINIIEKNPIIIYILKKKMNFEYKYILKKNKIKNIKIIYGDARKILYKLKKDKYPDIIYIDPFFLKLKNSAIEKTYMFILKKISKSHINTTNELIKISEKRCKKIIIIKSHIKSKLLLDNPTYQIFGSRIKFDIYNTSFLKN